MIKRTITIPRESYTDEPEPPMINGVYVYDIGKLRKCICCGAPESEVTHD